MKRILSYIKPHLATMSLGFAFKFIGTIMDLLIPWVLAHIIDDVIPQEKLSLVYLWGGGMLIFSAGAWITNILANRMASKVARESVRAMRHDLFERISYLSSNQIDRFTIPSLISRMTTDTYNIHQMIGMMQRMGVRAPILLLGGICITLTLDPVLTLALIITLPFMGGTVYYISRRGVPLFRKMQVAADELVRVVRENISGTRVVKALSKGDFETQRFEKTNANMTRCEQKATMNMALVKPFMNLILNFGLILVILIGAFRVNAGTSQVGKIMAFLTYFTVILNAMLSITRVITMYSKASASANRITEVLNTVPDQEIMLDSKTQDEDHICFHDVSFSYNHKEDNLSHISFSLKKGETLGIIGPTGAGKSTILALLLRFYDATEGTITINGRDIRSYDLHSLRGRFGVVFQNDTLFEGNIEQNILLGRAFSKKEVREAAASSQALEFIEDHRDFQSEVAIKGANLSGGQKQRLLIARALLGHPEILILDDSSSALDYKTDAALRAQLRTMFRNTTTIIVAQRISSIRHADHILVLEDGKILGYGTHEELMRSCELYHEISKMQMGEESNEK